MAASPARELYLGLDVGTQGTKALLVDGADGSVVARAGRSYGLIEGLPPGAAEQHPRTWLEAVAACAREVFAAAGMRAPELRGIGVSGQQHGLVPLDARGEPVRAAKLWCDTATAAEARELSQALGRHIPAGFTAPKVLWMARREPQAWARVATVLLPHEYVNLALTGQARAEAGDASGTGWLDVEARRYDEEAIGALDAALRPTPGAVGGLRAKLPALVEAGEPAGELSRAGAELLGLPREAAGVSVAAGGGDNMASAIGAGATRPGIAVLSLGTSATLFGHAARPVVDPAGVIAAFCDSTGGWLPLLCVMNATGVLEEVVRGFGAGHGELTAEARAVAPGCDGLLLVPYLSGERAPDLPHACGALHGLRPGLLTRGRAYRAALEGVALNLAWGAARLKALGVPLQRLRAVGGGARNELWLQILADVLDAEIERTLEPESAAYGAALQALWTARRAAGEKVGMDAIATRCVRTSGEPVRPEPRRTELYRERGEAFRKLVGALF